VIKILAWAGLVFLTWTIVSCSKQDGPNVNFSNSGGKHMNGEQSKVKNMNDIDSHYLSSESDWVEFLRCWNEKLVSKASENQNAAKVLELLTRDKTQLADVGSSRLSNRVQALKNLEQRLSAGKLPKSYRDFAAVTGGEWVASVGIDTVGFNSNLIAIENVGYFRDIDSTNWPGWRKAMEDSHLESRQLPANEYYLYDASQDHFRWSHLYKVVKVGELEQGAVLLINPAEVTSDGEWEAWLLSTQIGAYRYRSFAEMMQTIAYQEIFGVGGINISSEKLLSSCPGYIKTAATLTR